jgi:hypothetical protein
VIKKPILVSRRQNTATINEISPVTSVKPKNVYSAIRIPYPIDNANAAKIPKYLPKPAILLFSPDICIDLLKRTSPSGILLLKQEQ